ncbi:MULTISPECIES: ABC transporter ATP-binding protein [Thermus]|jgi:branched-chain amino acid transport system ATP-binding protein|uniref:ABC transporter ATP-binding protein n=1 Tax=Thermus brockianus TaxID=56956 RepID=A0A1J0LY20_THEBO|nr:ABC transporter ATP-binding protein [Thermus brockianus]APD10507.1 branched-chain amino acid ABC transporter ATP-binding protein [Thermus brockianus]BDG17455.1 ABC transporter ATP-binding protein [Thermus brockianus]
MSLVVEDLRAGYGEIPVLHGVSLRVEEGEVVALLGRNGAGKTTLIKAVMGLVRRFSGRLSYRHHDISDWPPYRRARLGLGYVPDDRRIFPELTVRENLLVAARPGPWNLERVFQILPRLAEIQNRRGGLLSGGEQQMLTIARTLLTNPTLLLLDEPTEGLAPLIVEEIARLVLALKAEGMPILLAEQNLRFTGRVADRAYVLETGEVRLEGPMEDLLQSDQVVALLSL